MKLDDILNNWRQDSTIDQTELGKESLRVPELHHKYYKMFALERQTLRSYQQHYKQLYRQKHEYYLGYLSEEELQECGWTPQPLKILKQDLPIYIEADSQLALAQERIDLQQDKLSLLESIIKMITNRGFQIKNAIDYLKFANGL